MWLIKLAGKVATIRYNPERVPEDEPLISLAEWHWPEARTAFKRHKANIHVSTVEKDDDPLLLARIVTAVVGALVDITPSSLAVIYNNKVMQNVELWKALSIHAFQNSSNYLLQLWLFFNPYKYDRGELISTIGLSGFVDREIEFDGYQGRFSTAEKTRLLASLILERKVHLTDGDEIRFSESETYNLYLRNSTRFQEFPVFLVTSNQEK